MRINNEADLRDACRETCVCLANHEPRHTDQMAAGILAGDHPVWGSDWSQWWADTEDYRLDMLRYGPQDQTGRDYLMAGGVEIEG